MGESNDDDNDVGTLGIIKNEQMCVFLLTNQCREHDAISAVRIPNDIQRCTNCTQ